eukprot:TRINITY_DN4838_c0_g1_i7.p1 TRINITY_DN4838_c0_g1~~TRINITY_DN4838_c0_g1_i7.p1  ORF type:complete len:235 (-),score=36.75 TRINITY_DN4838_c0_g1_i7:199-903(-)
MNAECTLATPSRDQSIRSVSNVITKMIVDSNSSSQPTCFDLDNFIPKSYQVVVPLQSRIHPITTFVQSYQSQEVPAPSVDSVYRFMKTIFEKLHLSTECSIIGLIYIERLLEPGTITLSARNWRPILLSALLTASKVWDDLSSWNVELSDLFPVFTLKDINQLERQFLDGLKYKLYISGSQYAKYYFALRSLRTNSTSEAKQIPRYYLRLGLGSAQKVEARSIASQDMGMPMSI